MATWIGRVWYEFWRQYVKIGLYFYFGEIKVFGRENLPKGGLIFTPNHQNALTDALILICHTSLPVHSLVRASVFKIGWVSALLHSLKMLPVFRIRDGLKTINNNDRIFEQCCALIAKQDSLLIFPEGNHNILRKSPPLSKGFTRIAYGAYAMAKSSASVRVVPVSINYSQHHRSGSWVSLYFGNAIAVEDFYEKTGKEHLDALSLRDAVALGIAENLVQIPEPYADNERELKLKLGNDIIFPDRVNAFFSEKKQNAPIAKAESRGSFHQKLLAAIGYGINILPITLLRMLVKRLTKDQIFYATLKIGLGIFLFPLLIGFQSWLLVQFFGSMGYTYLLAAPVGVFAYTKFRTAYKDDR